MKSIYSDKIVFTKFVFKIIKEQIFIDESDHERGMYVTILQTCAVSGLGVGCLMGGTMLANGKR